MELFALLGDSKTVGALGGASNGERVGYIKVRHPRRTRPATS